MSVNKVTLVGRLGKDPETRYTPSNDAVVTFSLATSEQWKGKDGQKQERTEWHNIVIYGRLAEIAAQYLKKGQLVYLEGRIQSRKYTGKDNIERTYYEIVVNEMKMLSSKNESSQYYSGNEGSKEGSSSRSSDHVVPPIRQEVSAEEESKIQPLSSDIPF